MEGDWIDRSEFWNEKLRSFQLRIRNRFRVAVDRHWHRTRLSDSYYSSTFQRWVTRFRTLYGDSSQQPAVFRRKQGNKDEHEDSAIMRMLQSLAVPVIGNVCHVFMHGLNQIQIYGAEKLQHALLHRPHGKPLVTVSNHVASMDDPLVIASLLPPSVLLDSNSLRWTLCASDRCFTNPMTSAFFKCVKVLPVTRGEGIYQKGMDMALSKLNSGGWVHIFPEGSRSRDGGRTIGSAKRGVGRLVMDADKVPLVVPFVHTGMQDVMPIGSSFPRIGKKVTVVIGDPIYLDDLASADESLYSSRDKLYDAVSTRISHHLHELKVQVDNLVLEESLQAEVHPLRNREWANVILHQVDWDGFGTGGYTFQEDISPSSNPQIVTRPGQHDLSWKPARYNWTVKMSSYEGGIMSRIRGYMNPYEIRGFAAAGLLMDRCLQEDTDTTIGGASPLKPWKRFLEANIFQQWNRM
ncbi:hypothetical protein H6P81_015875 [Aristolochia fimbriata]|uniref:Tafazzin family protein n=1 Tax=Aristolochia fimbriata TaxID=158543 RepID=A0AAV7E8V6_ARIFI|nr:hypothetical protein H6P81_015875 [Aristolochia fimbriata]